MITYEQYQYALIINKSDISAAEFPAFAAEAERLIQAAVTSPIPEKYDGCYADAACKLCSQLYADSKIAKPVDETGAALKSQSETSGKYSYSVSYAETLTDAARLAAYNKIITDGLTYCEREFTGLFCARVGFVRR